MKRFLSFAGILGTLFVNLSSIAAESVPPAGQRVFVCATAS